MWCRYLVVKGEDGKFEEADVDYWGEACNPRSLENQKLVRGNMKKNDGTNSQRAYIYLLYLLYVWRIHALNKLLLIGHCDYRQWFSHGTRSATVVLDEL